MKALTRFLLLAFLVLAPFTSTFAGIFISVGFAPPPLPVYAQPICPDDGYIWVPGYWAYGDYGYYWVPGTWVQAPEYGLLWTPGYWGWDNGYYYFHPGYWGTQVGFYGGIDYGYGYGGQGYDGGRWRGHRFYYNAAANNVHSAHTYRAAVAGGGARTSFNGGTGGVQARPTAQQRTFARASHVPATSTQQAVVRAAALDRSQLATANGGRPATLTAAKPTTYTQVARRHASTQPLTRTDVVKKPATTTTSTTVRPEALPNTTHAGATHTDLTTRQSTPKATTHKVSHPKAQTYSRAPGESLPHQSRAPVESTPRSRPPIEAAPHDRAPARPAPHANAPAKSAPHPNAAGKPGPDNKKH
jgi:hypothetical protein